MCVGSTIEAEGAVTNRCPALFKSAFCLQFFELGVPSGFSLVIGLQSPPCTWYVVWFSLISVAFRFPVDFRFRTVVPPPTLLRSSSKNRGQT